jgi:hypothetical protein
VRKRRGWLIGFGLGIALGAAVLQLMTAADSVSGSDRLPNEPLSLEELKKEAGAKGYDLVRSGTVGDKTYTQQQLDQAVAEAKQAAEAAAKASAGKSAASGSGERTIMFYIWEKASLQDVANGLKGIGLIDDKAAFIRQAKPYANKLRVGVCVFTGKPSYEQIIAELTRGKN